MAQIKKRTLSDGRRLKYNAAYATDDFRERRGSGAGERSDSPSISPATRKSRVAYGLLAYALTTDRDDVRVPGDPFSTFYDLKTFWFYFFEPHIITMYYYTRGFRHRRLFVVKIGATTNCIDERGGETRVWKGLTVVQKSTRRHSQHV